MSPICMESVVDVVLIHAAVASCFAVDKDGVVYQAGTCFNLNIENNGTQFLPVKQFSNIIEIASSQTHILFVDASGSVWSFGKNVSCQLALGHSEPVENHRKFYLFQGLGGAIRTQNLQERCENIFMTELNKVSSSVN